MSIFLHTDTFLEILLLVSSFTNEELSSRYEYQVRVMFLGQNNGFLQMVVWSTNRASRESRSVISTLMATLVARFLLFGGQWVFEPGGNIQKFYQKKNGFMFQPKISSIQFFSSLENIQLLLYT